MMPFYVDKDGESYLAYLERLEEYHPEREPLGYYEFLEAQAEFDRYYTPLWDELESEGHPITHPSFAKIKILEDRLAV